jgi:hypothetical protein
MRSIPLIAVMLMFIPVLGVQAEVVEIALPQLEGQYGAGDTWGRGTSFQLPQPPLAVHGAWLRLIGTVNVREVKCVGSAAVPRPVYFDASMRDYASGGWWGVWQATPEDSGEFELTAQFMPNYEPTWDFLSDGTGEMGLVAHSCPESDNCWPVTTCSDAVLTEVVFIVSADFPVPIEPTTWGRIKALYDSSP